MNNILKTGIGILSIFAATATYASHRAGSFGISGMYGYYNFGSSAHTEDHAMPLLGLSYDLTDQVGMELLIGDMSTDKTRPSQENGSTSANTALYMINAVYHYRKGQAFQPYITGGMGIIRLTNDDYDNNEQLGFNAGAGVEYYLAKDFALRGEVRGIYSPYDSRLDYMPSVGFTITLG